MRVLGVVLAVVFLTSCSEDPSEGPDPDAARSPASPAPSAGEPDPVRVPCEENIETIDARPTDRSSELVHDAAALPSTSAPALQTVPVDEPTPDTLPGDGWLWAKRGIAIRGGNSIRLSVAPESADQVRIGWGWAPIPRSTVVKAQCSASAGWRAFPGGYWVKEPGCYAVLVEVDDRPARRVDIGIGKPCPGQQPPPSFAAPP